MSLAPSDIGVTMSAAPDPVRVGQDLTYTVTVSNHGPAAATQIGLDVRLSHAASFSNFAPVGVPRLPYGCYVETDYFSCTVDRLQARATWTLQFIVKPKEAGPLSHRVTVGKAQPDPVPANNSATVEVRVQR
jgi:hypothetical protein